MGGFCCHENCRLFGFKSEDLVDLAQDGEGGLSPRQSISVKNQNIMPQISLLYTYLKKEDIFFKVQVVDLSKGLLHAGSSRIICQRGGGVTQHHRGNISTPNIFHILLLFQLKYAISST